MIRYALVCRAGHEFESWFQHSGAFDAQTKAGLVICPACGSAEVEKALMTPRLALAGNSARRRGLESPEELGEAASPPPDGRAPPEGRAPPKAKPSLETRASSAETKATVAIMSPQEREFRAKLKELRDHLTRSSEHVGARFPEEARKMHYGETQRRSIYGEASPDEARALIEEGIAFHPLPALPDDQN